MTTIATPETLTAEALRGDQAAAIEADANGLTLRPPTDKELADVLTAWSRQHSFLDVHVDKINVNLDVAEKDRTFSFNGKEVPATSQGLTALARILDMPVKYTLDVPPDEQQFMFTHRLHRHGDARFSVEYSDSGVETITDTRKVIVSPFEIASEVAKYMPVESPVRDFWATPDDLRLDVYLPDGWDGPGIGGDRKVGDITHGGVRVFQNRKQNLAPGCQSFMYRLVCTNGMEVVDVGRKIDARNKDAVEVVQSLGYLVRETMDTVAEDIKHFYDLRRQKVDKDRTGSLRRVAQDAGLSERVVGQLEDRLASVAETSPTMFDFANLITNLANVHPLTAAARSLQQAGGSLVVDHAARCRACHHRL